MDRRSFLGVSTAALTGTFVVNNPLKILLPSNQIEIADKIPEDAALLLARPTVTARIRIDNARFLVTLGRDHHGKVEVEGYVSQSDMEAVGMSLSDYTAARRSQITLYLEHRILDDDDPSTPPLPRKFALGARRVKPGIYI
jgi:hypothetical protein